ncbi:MAG: hypothetical protein RDU13_00470 [Elusimicrobiales bacterium]|jgi:hypothetical protein|nr:hypothetical protein [Elusimicrobiales bacterium]
MRIILPALPLVLLWVPTSFAQVTEERVRGVEVRVQRLETRVTALEGTRPAGGAAAPVIQKEPAVPVMVQFLRKQNVVEGDKFGLRLFLHFQNLSTRTLRSFKGRLVLSGEKGEVLYDRPFAWDEPLLGSESMEIMVTVVGGSDKAYLRLLRAKVLNARLQKQEAVY